MTTYRVVDMRPEATPDIEAIARSPEKAASEALHMTLVRSGTAKNLICRVYWTDDATSQLNVIRLYTRHEKLH